MARSNKNKTEKHHRPTSKLPKDIESSPAGPLIDYSESSSGMSDSGEAYGTAELFSVEPRRSSRPASPRTISQSLRKSKRESSGKSSAMSGDGDEDNKNNEAGELHKSPPAASGPTSTDAHARQRADTAGTPRETLRSADPSSNPATQQHPGRRNSSSAGDLTREELNAKDEAYYEKTLEAQQEADEWKNKAVSAEARERKLKKEVDERQKSEDALVEELRQLKEKEVNDAKDKDSGAAVKAHLEDQLKDSQDELARMIKELKLAQTRLREQKLQTDQSLAVSHGLHEQLDALVAQADENENAVHEGVEAKHTLELMNQELESIFENLGSNLTLDDYMNHIRDLHSGRARRDSQTSLHSVHPSRPKLKNRTVSIQHELDAALDTESEDGASILEHNDPSGLPNFRHHKRMTSDPSDLFRKTSDPLPSSTNRKRFSGHYPFTQVLPSQPEEQQNDISPDPDFKPPPSPLPHPIPQSRKRPLTTTTPPAPTSPASPLTWLMSLLLFLLSMVVLSLYKDHREWMTANDTGHQYLYKGLAGEVPGRWRGEVEGWLGVERGLLG